MRSELPPVIAGQGRGSYVGGMLALSLRLLTLVALALLPLGMPASAASRSPAMADHCGEQDHEAPTADAKIHCAVCTVLPPLGPAVSRSAAAAQTVPAAAAVRTFEGMELEIATPPPKHA